jgi:hypothetical protein
MKLKSFSIKDTIATANYLQKQASLSASVGNIHQQHEYDARLLYGHNRGLMKIKQYNGM